MATKVSKRTALDSCGRLKKGDMFVKGGEIVKVTTKKTKKKTVKKATSKRKKTVAKKKVTRTRRAA